MFSFENAFLENISYQELNFISVTSSFLAQIGNAQNTKDQKIDAFNNIID